MFQYLRQALILMPIIFVLGCSTYRVYDSYLITDERKPSYKTTEAESSLRVEDEIRFYSIGLLGLPVIPTVIKISDNKKITIESILRLNKENNFYIKTQSCLIVDKANKICPNELIVNAVGMYQDDGTAYSDGKKRWNKLQEFTNRTDLIVPLQGEVKPSQIGQEEIYRHYDYKKQPAWEWLQVRFVYKFDCPEKCPDQFSLDAKDFLKLNGQTVIDGEYLYQKKRHHDYDFMTNIQ